MSHAASPGRGMDLYLWLTYRQFGLHPNKASENNTVQAFRYKFLRELKKIKLAWPGLNYATAKGFLILFPSKPAIAPTTDPQRLVE